VTRAVEPSKEDSLVGPEIDLTSVRLGPLSHFDHVRFAFEGRWRLFAVNDIEQPCSECCASYSRLAKPNGDFIERGQGQQAQPKKQSAPDAPSRFALTIYQASLRSEADLNEIKFQCPNCGHDLQQSIGRLKINDHEP